MHPCRRHPTPSARTCCSVLHDTLPTALRSLDQAIDMRKAKAIGRGILSSSQMSALDGDEDGDEEDVGDVVDPFVVSLANEIEPLGHSLYTPRRFWPGMRGAAELGLMMTELAISLEGAPSFSDFCQLIVVSRALPLGVSGRLRACACACVCLRIHFCVHAY